MTMAVPEMQKTLLPEVEYREIPGAWGYFARTDGTIWSGWRPGNHGPSRRPSSSLHILKPFTMPSGHESVTVTLNGRAKHYPVHQLVLMTFVGPCPQGMETRHLDDDPHNNTIQNLCWGTRKDNHKDRKRNGRHLYGTTAPSTILTEKQVVEIWYRLKRGESQFALGREYGVSRGAILGIKRRVNWRHLTKDLE